MKGVTYLAAPYTHPDPEVRAERYRVISKFAAELMLGGTVVYSPISHGHAIEMEHGGPMGTHAFWLPQCFGILRHCSELLVLRLPGWDKSVGVAAEIDLAQTLGIPVNYTDLEDSQP